MHERTAESILRALHSGADLARVARAHDLPLRDVALWASTGAGAEAVSALRDLARARAALAVSRARADAARALARLARGADETARKACVDLLRLPDADPARAPAVTTPDDDLSAEEARAWLDALETLGAAPTSPAGIGTAPEAPTPPVAPSATIPSEPAES